MTQKKQQRKDTLSLRIEPRIKYLIDIASRLQRRNVTNYVEQVLENSLKEIEIEKDVPLLEADLWDIDEADRLVKLAYSYPLLLTYEEQRIIKTINENFYLFKKDKNEMIFDSPDQENAYESNLPMLEFIDFKKIRNKWQNLNDYANNKADLDLS